MMAVMAAADGELTTKQFIIALVVAALVFWGGLVGVAVLVGALSYKLTGAINGWLMGLFLVLYYAGGLYAVYKVLEAVLHGVVPAVIITGIVSGIPIFFLVGFGNMATDPRYTLLRIERELKKK